ncbi:MAG: hypothetical protein FK734_21735 [Asgard group archaeon]|nr:hypothetical protein [Asgard group archaeon]
MLTDKSIIQQNDEQIIIGHSNRRKLIETSFFILFCAIGIFAIVFGFLFAEESLYFRIPLIIIGFAIILLYLEAITSIFSNKIVLNKNEIKVRLYFKWQQIEWSKIKCINLEKKNASRKSDTKIEKYISIELVNFNDEIILYPLFKFRAYESVMIVEAINNFFQISKAGELNSISLSDITLAPKAKTIEMTNEEIDKMIPPKVEDYEVGE